MQSSCKSIKPTAYVNSRAFRSGYDDYRAGNSPRFGQWGMWDTAYEEGRLTAASVEGRGETLRVIPTRSKVAHDDLRWLLMARYKMPHKLEVA